MNTKHLQVNTTGKANITVRLISRDKNKILILITLFHKKTSTLIKEHYQMFKSDYNISSVNKLEDYHLQFIESLS